MADQGFELDVLHDLLKEASVVAQLARGEKTFLSVYEAFRAGDRKAFQTALRRVKLVPQCQLVCEWMRIKECVFLCLDLCGPPKVEERPNPRVLAAAIVRITSDDKLVAQLAQAVEKRDRAAFQRIVKAQKLEPFCHLFCHWVCYVHYQLVCRWVCDLELEVQPSLIEELQTAGRALGMLVKNREAFDEAVAASQAGDADKFNSVLEKYGLLPFCRWICFFFCSWRCGLVCFTLCRQFSLGSISSPLQEAFAFAKETAKLAQQPALLERLSAAVGAGDMKAYAAAVEELKLQRYCIQLCHWLCFLRCRRFCICLPTGLKPEFTSIGGLDYLTDVNSTAPGNGLTIADGRAFTDLAGKPLEKPVASLRLNGVLPEKLSGSPMEYRFEFCTTNATGGSLSAWKPVLPFQIAPTLIGHWQPIFGPTKRVWVNHPSPPAGDIVISVDSVDGWIKVPQDNFFGNFSQNGNQIDLISSNLPALGGFPSKDESGIITGNAPAHPLVQDSHVGLRMRARKVGVPASEVDAGTCAHVALDNTYYDNVKPHPAWDGGAAFPPGQRAVRMVNIQELGSTGCQKITDSLTVLFTAGHPNLGSVSISMAGGGGTYSFTLPPAGADEWFGTATPSGWTVGSLQPCAYLVTLTANLLLTDGDNDPIPLYDQIAFCKAQ
jgi:hypothetical protein